MHITCIAFFTFNYVLISRVGRKTKPKFLRVYGVRSFYSSQLRDRNNKHKIYSIDKMFSIGFMSISGQQNSLYHPQAIELQIWWYNAVHRPTSKPYTYQKSSKLSHNIVAKSKFCSNKDPAIRDYISFFYQNSIWHFYHKVQF